MPKGVACFVVVVLLAACGGEPRAPMLSYDRAIQDDRPLTMKVLKVYDANSDIAEPTIDTSHVIEVEILAPESRHGERIALPYNEWNVGAPPPKAGETVTAPPAYWLKGNGSSHGKPMHGWNDDGSKKWEDRFK